MDHKEGKKKFLSSPEGSMGFMFQFKDKGKAMWVDATEERPGYGQLINHSKCHSDVSNFYRTFAIT